MLALLELAELESERSQDWKRRLTPTPPLPHRQGFLVSKLPPHFLALHFGKEAGSWVLVIPLQDKHLWDKASNKTHTSKSLPFEEQTQDC